MDARDVALDAALEQELRGELPPDLAEQVMARSREVAPRAAQRWLTAALVLVAVGLVSVVWSVGGDGSRSARSPGDQDPRPWHNDLIVPESVGDALRLVDAHDRLDVQVFAVRDPASGRLVSVVAHPLEDLLAPLFGQGKPRPVARADAEQDAAWTGGVRELLGAVPASGDPFASYPLEMLFHVPDRGTLVVGVDDTVDPARVQVRGLPAVWTARPGGGLPAALRATLAPALRDAIQGRGLAIGRAGLDALQSDATRIRAHSLRAEDLDGLARFTKLATLDLTGSPASVTPDALRALARCAELRSLTLPADGIGAAHLEPVVALPALRELFVGWGWDRMFRSAPPVTTAIDDRCAEMLTRAAGLRELFLPSTVMTDAGVAKLAELGELTRLTVGSAQIHGTGFAAFDRPRGLKSVALCGCEGLTTEGLAVLGAALGRAIDSRSEVGLVECPVSRDGIAALCGAGAVHELFLLRCRASGSWPGVIAAIAAARGVGKLTLTIDDDLRLEHLVHLAGAASLQDVEVAVTEGGELDRGAEAALKAALPGVRVDVWYAPR